MGKNIPEKIYYVAPWVDIRVGHKCLAYFIASDGEEDELMVQDHVDGTEQNDMEVDDEGTAGDSISQTETDDPVKMGIGMHYSNQADLLESLLGQ